MRVQLTVSCCFARLELSASSLIKLSSILLIRESKFKYLPILLLNQLVFVGQISLKLVKCVLSCRNDLLDTIL